MDNDSSLETFYMRPILHLVNKIQSTFKKEIVLRDKNQRQIHIPLLYTDQYRYFTNH